jgi:hypothetical protein
LLGILLTTLVLAGLPLNRLVIGGRTGVMPLQFTVWHLVPISLGLLLVAAAGWALFGGLPRWGYTWLYAVLVMLSMALMALGDDRPFLIWPWVDAFIALALFGTLVAVAFHAARRGTVDALVAGLGFGTAFVLVNFSAVSVPPFRRVDLALLVLPAGLVFSGLIAWAARDGSRVGWAAAALTVALGAGLMALYTRALSGVWAGSGSLFATRVVQIAVIGLIGPPVLASLHRAVGRARGSLVQS